jgi:N-acetylated-alpha-linked acidic dipeptidase
MAPTFLLLLAIASSATACQRDILSQIDTQHPDHHTLKPRQAAAFPPVWTKEEQILHSSFSKTELDTWSSYYTHGNHIAGLNKSMAEETAKKWIANGVPSSLVEYEVYLNYPKEQGLVLKWANGSSYKAQMYEDVLSVDETTLDAGAPPTFHGYSKSGSVEAEYVYVG